MKFSYRVCARPAFLPATLLSIPPPSHRFPDSLLYQSLPSASTVCNVLESHPGLRPDISFSISVPFIIPFTLHQPQRRHAHTSY